MTFRSSVTEPAGTGVNAADARRLPVTVGHYRIVRILGEGGMGTVYEAEQEQPRRTVALKVIKPGWASPEMLRRFEQESLALGRLQHPGIAQIHEAATADSGSGPQPYFAMEFIRGDSLHAYVAAQHLNTRERLELMVKVCEAVHHAHQRGIIHRDLKPGNILVDESGQPKILDFGVARVTDSDAYATRQTDVGQLVGTLAYMSPEQVLADPLELDVRSDVYALGVILYELLAGRLPYAIGRQIHEATRAIREEDPSPLSSISRVYRGDIETIVAKSLEKEKTRRYASAADLASDIGRYLRDEPITARPPSTAYQLQKFARRHKALVWGIAAVFIVLGKEHPDTLSADNNLGQLYREQGKFAEAEPILASAMKVRQRLLGEEHPDTLVTMANLGIVLHEQGKYAEAEPILTKVLETERRIRGEEHQETLISMLNLAKLYGDVGKLAQAEALLSQVVDVGRRTLGEEHPRVLGAMNNLASIYYGQGKYAEAASVFATLLEVKRRILGAEHPDTLTGVNNLAVMYRQLGRHEEAEALLTKLAETQRRVLGDEHPNQLATLSTLGHVYQRRGRLAEAKALYTKSLEGQRRVNGPEHLATLSTMRLLGGLYRDEGNYTRAEALLREALSGFVKIRPGFWARFEIESTLGASLAGQRRFAEAEPLLLAGYEGLARLEAAIPPVNKSSLEHAGEWMVELYERWDKPAKAAEWRQKLQKS